jgi:hypothetical protein
MTIPVGGFFLPSKSMAHKPVTVQCVRVIHEEAEAQTFVKPIWLIEILVLDLGCVSGD